MPIRPVTDTSPFGEPVNDGIAVRVETVSADGRYGVVHAFGQYPGQPDGVHSEDYALYLQDLASPSNPQRISVANGRLPLRPSVSRDGSVVAYCDFDEKTEVSRLLRWDRTTQATTTLYTWAITGDDHSCWNPFVSGDGRFVTAGIVDKTAAAVVKTSQGVLLHDSQAKAPGVSLIPLHVSEVIQTSITADGRLVSYDSGDYVGAVQVYDRQTKTLRTIGEGQMGMLSDDGSHIIYWDRKDRYFRYYDLKTKKAIALIRSVGYSTSSAHISRNGRFVTLPAGDHVVRIDMSTLQGEKAKIFDPFRRYDYNSTTTDDGALTAVKRDRLWERP